MRTSSHHSANRCFDSCRTAARRLLPIGIVAATVCGVLAMTPKLAAADTTRTITFDDLTAGTYVTNQYQSEGVEFVTPPAMFQSGSGPGNDQISTSACDGSFPQVITASNTQSPPNAAALGTCGDAEFPDHGSFGQLDTETNTVSAYVGDPAGETNQRFELDAYGADGTLVASNQVTTSTAGVRNPITVTSASDDIEFFAIYWVGAGTDEQLAMDDLSFNVPATVPPPAIELEIQGGQGLGVLDGQSNQKTLVVHRINGSNGPVTMGIAGVPVGITWSFTPSDGTDDTWTLALAAPATQPAGTFPVTITASPASASSGTVPSQVTANLLVGAAFMWSGNATTATPCTPMNLPVPLWMNPGFAGQVTLSVSGLQVPGFDVSFSQAVTDAQDMDKTTLQVSVSPQPSASSASVVLNASSPGYPTQSVVFGVQLAAPQIYSVELPPPVGTTPNTLWQGRYRTPGSQIQITGTGFCPETKVGFGDPGDFTNPGNETASVFDASLATPDYIASDGRSMLVTVPHYAVSGAITVVEPEATATSKDTFDVVQYRNTDGFDFGNNGWPTYSWSDVVNVFGQNQMYVQTDPCATLTFGIFSCSLGSLPVPSPAAWIFYQVIKDDGQGGICWGLAAGSLALSGQGPDPLGQSLGDFPPVGATDVYQLNQPDAYYFAAEMHLVQESAEVEGARNSEDKDKFASAFRQQIIDVLNQGHPALIDMWQGSQGGHTVVAYDLTDNPDGSFDVWVYNPDAPYNSDEQDNSSGALDNHFDAEADSVIQVNEYGQWSFSGLGWSGDMSSIDVFGPSIVPSGQPTIPDSLQGLDTYLTNGATSVSQVTDTEGQQLLRSDGSTNNSSTGIPGADVLPSLDGDGAGRPTILLPSGGTYEATLRANSSGPLTAGLLSQSSDALVTGSAPKGKGTSPITMGFDTETASLSTSASRPLQSTVTAREADGSYHTAMLLSGRGRYSVSLARRTGSVVVSGTGTVRVELGWTSTGGPAQSYETPALHLARGQELVLRPVSWSSLSGAPVTAELDGRTLRLHDTLASASLRGLRLSSKLVHRHVRMSLRWKSSGYARTATAAVSWSVFSGSQLVTAHDQTMSVGQLERHRDTWLYTPRWLSPGKYRVVADVVVEASQPGTAVASSTVGSERLSLTVGRA